MRFIVDYRIRSAAPFFHGLFDSILSLVEITIDLQQADIFFEVLSQIVYRSFLAHRRAYPRHYQMAQFLILNGIETNPVVNFIDDCLR